MLKRKALRKILVTTFTVFILMVVYLIPDIRLNKSISSDYTIEYVNTLETDTVYLLGSNNYLIKTNLLIEGENVLDKAKNILNSLTVGKNKNLPDGSTGIIPNKTKILGLKLTDKIITVDFSEEILKIEPSLEEKMVEVIIYSLTSLPNIEGIKIEVNNQSLTEFPYSHKKLPVILNRDFGINKVYDLNSKEDINKVTIYYLETDNSHRYYVPVTRYVNDERDKIQIIIDSLSSNYIYQPNLTSFLRTDAKLLNYQIEDQLMILDFNENIFDSSNKILEEVLYTISYSVFDNYDVNEVMLRVNEKEVFKKLKKDIE